MPTWNSHGTGFWSALERLWREGGSRRAAFMRAVYTRLALEPAPVSMADSPRGVFGFTDWEERYWRRPVPGGSAGDQEVLALREEIARDPFAELEGLRLAAFLAVHGADGLRRRAQGDAEETKRWARARLCIRRWLEAVIERSEETLDLYFAQHRLRDARTHTPEERRRRDPYVAEVMTLLFDDTHRPTELRPAFRDPGQSEILPQVARWLIRRYAFREARHLLGAWRRSDEVGGLFWNLRLQRSWLPRLAATAAVGTFAVASQLDVWRLLADLSGRPLSWAACAVPPFLLMVFLVYVEIRKRVRWYPRPWPTALRISSVGMAWSLIWAGVAYLLATSLPDAAFLSALDSAHGLRLLVLEAAAALLLGYLLQILWDDKAISEAL